MEILNLTHNKMDQLLAMKLEFQFFQKNIIYNSYQETEKNQLLIKVNLKIFLSLILTENHQEVFKILMKKI